MTAPGAFSRAAQAGSCKAPFVGRSLLAQGVKLSRESGSRERGVVLADVMPRGPADHAGLRAGDFELSLDGKPMDNSRQLQVNVYRHLVGDVVTLEILRDGRWTGFWWR